MTHSAEQLTDQQHAAIYTRDVSVALSAGAGCGKTFVLTRRFLVQLEQAGITAGQHKPRRRSLSSTASATGSIEAALSGHDRLHGLVAITFTERAAREMRDRIRSACQKKLKECAETEVDDWQAVLRGLDTSRISTIHAFCAAFLRAHAVEAGVDPLFSVLEAATGDVVLRRAVSNATESLLRARNGDAMQLVLHFGFERTQSIVRSLVRSRFRCGPEDFSNRTPDQHADEWRARWQTVFVPMLLAELADSENARRIVEILAHNEPSHAKMQQRRQILLERLPLLPTAADPMAALDELREAAKVQGGGGKDAWSDERIYELVRDSLAKLRDALRDAAGEIRLDDTDLADAARFSLMFFRVARFAAEMYESAKRDGGYLDFDDLLIRTRDLLRDHEPVRRRAARGIDLLMVDEFQDTDPVQSEIILHLCGGNVAAGRLFLVGDAKQSIYRFRNADPRVFAALRETLPEQGRLPLSRNFRSQPAVLNFVNCLFTRTFGAAYEKLVPHAAQVTPEPAVEFLFSSASADELPTQGRELSETRRRREADWIARRIAGLLNGDEMPVRTVRGDNSSDPLRRPRPGDIAILFRTLSNVAIYEDALRRYGIEYYLVGGRDFFAQQEVFDLANLLSSLDDPDDEVSLAGVLRSPLFSLRDDTLFALVENSGTLRGALESDPPRLLDESQQRQVCYAARILAELRFKKDRLPIASLLKLAIDRTGYDAALLNEFLGRRKVANLQKLFEMARQFDNSGFGTMGEFVTRLRDSVMEQTDEELAATHPESSNVVRLMTIHQSKGLEFPIVVIADMDWTRRGGSSGPQHHPFLGPIVPLPDYRGEKRRNIGMRMHKLENGREDDLEKLRLLYVATTRAADLLILSAGLDPARKLNSEWMRLIAERFDIDTGLPARDPYLGRLSMGEIPQHEIPQIRVHHAPPEIGRGKPPLERPLSLDKFRETVQAADPAPLPAMLARFAPKLAPRTIVSVSRIDEADRAVRPAFLAQNSDELFFDGSFEEGGKGRNLGSLVHGMLERIGFDRNVDLAALATHVAYGLFRGPENSLEPLAIERVRAFMASEVWRQIAEARQRHREVEFLLRWPPAGRRESELFISGKIDLLAELPDGRWLLIDYKTGQLPHSEPGAVLEKYGLQLAVYALAAREFSGRIPECVEVVAVHDSVVRFPFAVTNTFLASAESRIDAAISRWLRDDAS